MQTWGDLRKRSATAIVLGPMALLCVWLGSYWWIGLMALCMIGLAWEWVRLCGGSTRTLPAALVPAAVLLAAALSTAGYAWHAAASLPAAAAIIFTMRGRQPSTSYWCMFGVIYIGFAGVSLIELRQSDPSGRENIFFLLSIVWASDISAYSFGRLVGGPKLAPSISPNKTWAGVLGGIMGAASVGLVVAVNSNFSVSTAKVIGIAIVLGIATQCGDLFESWVKRHFGVKDSSHLIPGHGGLLDRLDGLLVAAPVAAALSLLVGPGMQLWR